MSSTYSPLRWGILGAGSIAGSFAGDVQPLPDQEIVAVGSRDAEKAHSFADKFAIERRHTTYEALVNDPHVDAIYVATPHPFHKEHSLLALRAGKHVLCEKPFTINAAEAEAVIVEARGRNLFLMEAMWSRFFPIWEIVRQRIALGEIGEVRQLVADFGFKGGKTGDDGRLDGVNPDARLYNLALGGGALMDVGVYPVSLAQMLFGAPSEVAALGTLGHTGVDENVGMLLQYPNGSIAALSTSLQVNTAQAATIVGTEGKIEVRSPWWCPKHAVVTRSGQLPETIETPFEGRGFQFEAQEVAACLRTGKTESEILSHDATLSVMKTLDALREKLGVKYPME